MTDDAGRKARYSRQNFVDRLFPGPSNEMSRQNSEHVQRLLKSRGDQPQSPMVAKVSQEAAHARDTLDEQTELLKAILASSVDSQKDARSTAQNSRTFAWASTIIALLTCVATVISVIAVVQGH
jgi:hypothetical protein